MVRYDLYIRPPVQGMYNKIVEFNEFNRLREERDHEVYWEKEYRSQTKEMLLNDLLEEQEKNFPMAAESSKGFRRFQALIKVIEEKSTTSWLKQMLEELRSNALSNYRKLSEKKPN